MFFEKRKNSLIVTLKGEIDHHVTDEIRKRTDKEFDSSNAKNLIFDFSGVDFMDSAGIGLLIGRYKLVSKAGGKVAVCCVSPSASRILELSGIYKIIMRYNSVEDAISTID